MRYTVLMRAVFVVALFLVGCSTPSPLGPTPLPPPVVPLPIALAGQSNADLMYPALQAAYVGTVVGAKARNPGSTLDHWAEGGSLWLGLVPDLHQPLRAFIWWQGESDRQPGRVEVYEAALRAFLARVRREANDPTLFIVICRVVDDPIFARIRAAQAAYVASDPRAVLVSSDGLPLEGPGSAHLSPAGYVVMSQRILAVLP